MAFFLIVPSVMIVGIVLVHALAKRLGLQIFYKTLAAVAVLSIAAVFAAAKFAPAVGKDFLFLLGLIISAASLLATLLNRFLLKRQRAEEERFTEEVKAAYAAETQKKSAPPDESLATLETFDVAESDEEIFRPPSRYDEIREAILSEEPQGADEESAPVTEEPAQVAPVTEKISAPSEPESVLDEIPDDQKNFPLEKVFKPLAVVKPAEADKPVKLEEQPDPAEKFPLQEAFKPLAVVKPAEADKPVKPAAVKTERAEFFPLQEVFTPLSTVNLDKMEELAQTQHSVEPEKVHPPVKSFVEPAKVQPTVKPSVEPAKVQPTVKLSVEPAVQPLVKPSVEPAKVQPTVKPSVEPAKIQPLVKPSVEPAKVQSTVKPSAEPAQVQPTVKPSVEPAKVQPTVKPSVEPAKVQPPVKPSVEPAQIQPTVETAKPPPDNFETLDEILDRAYAERDKGHIWQAIELYRKALERYRADEYAPFVAIDLGNIYKEQALYAKAIKTYEDALNLPAVRRNATVKKDFLNNLRYLRIVRDVLIKHRASSTPFTKLPKPILREIDAEFSRMQLNPAQSK